MNLRSIPLFVLCLTLLGFGPGAAVTLASGSITGSQTVTGTFKPDGAITILTVLTNQAGSERADALGTDEFYEDLPSFLTVQTASATSGVMAQDELNHVTWNGAIAANGSITITITATIAHNAGGATARLQGFIAEGPGYVGTDDPAVAGTADANVFDVLSVAASAVQAVAGTFAPRGLVTYTVSLANTGRGDQPDNDGPEFSEVLPPELTLLSATATSGTVTADPATNTITWDGEIPGLRVAPGTIVIAIGLDDPTPSVTITITAQVKDGMEGRTVSAQGQVHYDALLSGSNTAQRITHPPGWIGAGFTPSTTDFTVAADQDVAFVAPSGRAITIEPLANDANLGASHQLVQVSSPAHGTATIGEGGVLKYQSHGLLPRGGDLFLYTADDGAGGASYAYSVSVHSFRDAAGAYRGSVEPSAAAAEASQIGVIDVAITAAGTFSGAIVLGDQRFPFRGALDSAGRARFAPKAAPALRIARKASGSAAQPEPLALAFAFTNSSSVDQLKATIVRQQDQSDFASATIDRAALPGADVPTSVFGSYTVAFAAPEIVLSSSPTEADVLPRGRGLAHVTVNRAGRVVVAGTLADGTPLSCGSFLRKVPPVPEPPGIIFLPAYTLGFSNGFGFVLHAAPYHGHGALSGAVTFLQPAATDDLLAPALHWIRPAKVGSGNFAPGWAEGNVTTTATGSKFQAKTADGIFAGLAPASLTGNASLDMEWPAKTPLRLHVNIDANGGVTFISPPAGLNPRLRILRDGTLSGSFLEADKLTAIHGVLLQRQHRGEGFFVGETRSGGVWLMPN